jgi:hypothetical protein
MSGHVSPRPEEQDRPAVKVPEIVAPNAVHGLTGEGMRLVDHNMLVGQMASVSLDGPADT